MKSCTARLFRLAFWPSSTRPVSSAALGVFSQPILSGREGLFADLAIPGHPIRVHDSSGSTARRSTFVTHP